MLNQKLNIIDFWYNSEWRKRNVMISLQVAEQDFFQKMSKVSSSQDLNYQWERGVDIVKSGN